MLHCGIRTIHATISVYLIVALYTIQFHVETIIIVLTSLLLTQALWSVGGESEEARSLFSEPSTCSVAKSYHN